MRRKLISRTLFRVSSIFEEIDSLRPSVGLPQSATDHSPGNSHDFRHCWSFLPLRGAGGENFAQTRGTPPRRRAQMAV